MQGVVLHPITVQTAVQASVADVLVVAWEIVLMDALTAAAVIAQETVMVNVMRVVMVVVLEAV